jgi:SAM-dependent methyltransferase
MKRRWLAGSALGTAIGTLWLWQWERATGEVSRAIKYAVMRGTNSARLVQGRAHAPWVRRFYTLLAPVYDFTLLKMAHHLPRRIKRAGFAEVWRVLRPGGHFLLCDFGPPPKSFVGLTRLLARLSAWGGEYPEDNLEWRIPALIEEAGFGPVETIAQESLLRLFCIYFVSAYVPDELTERALEGS